MYDGLVVLFLTSAAFGGLLKFNDLLNDHGFHWRGRFRDFSGRALSCVGCVIFGMAVVFLSDVNLKIMWFAILISWVLRGCVDTIAHGAPVAAMLVFLAYSTCVPCNALRFCYFLVPLTAFGLLHDFLQYSKKCGNSFVRRIFLENQYLYWYAIVAAYFVLFAFDVELIVSIMPFTMGYIFFYSKTSELLLRRAGVERCAF